MNVAALLVITTGTSAMSDVNLTPPRYALPRCGLNWAWASPR